MLLFFSGAGQGKPIEMRLDLLARVAGEFSPFATDLQDFTILGVQHDGVGCGEHRGAKALLTAAQLRFLLVLGGSISKNAQQAQARGFQNG